MINPISTSLSGLMAASRKAEVVSSNIANADSVGSTDPKAPDQAYAAKVTQDVSTGDGGVRTEVLTRNPPFVPSYSPDSPLADSSGMVNAPNVNLDEELLNLQQAKTAYQSNAMVIRTSLKMQDALHKALDTKY